MPAHIGLSRDYSGFDAEDQNNPPKKFELSSVLNRRTFVIICFLIVSIGLPLILYLEIYDIDNLPAKIQGVCLVDSSYRIPCGRQNVSEANCIDILCCFEKRTNSCYHHEPSSYFFHQKDSDSTHYVPSQQNTPFGLPSLKEVKMNYFEDKESLRIYLNDTRTLLRKMKNGFTNFDILENENKKLSTTVYRKNTTEMLLTTLKGPLIVNEDYLEWTIQLTNESGTLFGLGQLKLDSNQNSTITKVIYKNQDDHNTLPMFMAYNNGKYHAAIVLHEGALQVTILPSYLILLKALYTGGIQLQIIDGPTPKDIYDKLRKEQGEQKLLSEWAHGLHICREEPATDIKALQEQYTSFVSTLTQYPNFKYESDCVHDDLLLHLLAENYTSAQTKELYESLGLSANFMLSYPPQIPAYSGLFQKFENKSIFFKNTTDGSLYVGKYKNFDVVYPIYSHSDVAELIEEILELFQDIKIKGFTFTNSWPQDDNHHKHNITSPFLDEDIQNSFSYTIPWNMAEDKDIHARYHNKYGSTLSTLVEEKLPVELSFSPVSDYNTNRPLITQNLNTSWSNLKTSLQSSLFNSLFGRNFLAVPVCGSNSYKQKLQEDLCLRWYLVAATMPIVRVSSRGVQKSPTNLYTKYTIEKVISVLDTRRSLVPYYRTILKEGGPLVRPMFFNFPNNEDVHGLDEQYMVGDAILVAQPLLPDIEILNVYLPPNRAWYEFWGGQRYYTKKGKEWVKIWIVKSDWVSFVAEGHIIPLVKKTSDGDLEITLKVAMKCSAKNCTSEGSILLEQFGDESIQFSATGKNITITPSTVKNKQIKDMIKSVCIYDTSSSKCDDSVDKFIV